MDAVGDLYIDVADACAENGKQLCIDINFYALNSQIRIAYLAGGVDL